MMSCWQQVETHDLNAFFKELAYRLNHEVIVKH